MSDEKAPAPTILAVPLQCHVQVNLDQRHAIFPAAHPLMIERFAIAIPIALLKQAMGAVMSAEGNNEAAQLAKAIAEKNGGLRG